MMKRFNRYYEWLIERYEKEDKLILNEGLIKSYSVDVLMKELKRRYSDVEYDQKTGHIFVTIPVKHEKGLIKKLNTYGYYIGDKEIDDKDQNILHILIEAKFPNEIPFNILHEQIKYCYHITTEKYVDKIKKIGLIPKQSVRQFYSHSENRIYLLLTDNPLRDATLLKKMLSINNNSEEPEKYYLLRINFHELSDNLVFYRDPRLIPDKNFKGTGIFTMGNIPPDKLEIIGEIY